MARLDVERKPGTNWIWWIIAFVLLLLLLWWIFVSRSTPVAEAPVTQPVATGAVVPAEPVTDLGVVLVPDRTPLVGRAVAITGARVQRAVSDRGFWVGTGSAPDQRLFVVRTHQSSPATPPNGAVQAGQTVSFWGTVERMPANLTDSTTSWNVSSTDVSALGTQGVYVAADSVRIGG